ncbi:MAG TPA: ABC transporter permease [Methylophilaceae bacterium]|jgi:phospholipid/cholesterol/gamma-HCH transport system permease protein
MGAASFNIDQDAQGRKFIRLAGQWSLRAIENDFGELKNSLSPFFSDPFVHWDLQQVEQLDAAGAAILLSGWGNKVSTLVTLQPEQVELFDTLLNLSTSPINKLQYDWLSPLEGLGLRLLAFIQHLKDFIQLLGLLLIEVGYLIKRPQDFPWREFSANVYKSGVTALPVTALLGFMIGVAMAYLMARQLRVFGADIFIVNIMGLAIIRELGPVLMAVLVAGRSGSAMTAQIGVMRVTEEIDALTTMGISRILRVILPKVLGLTFIAPFLVLWTSFWAISGGALSSNIELGIGFKFFFDYLPSVVLPVNLTLSLIKGVLFGFVVTLVACHFGLRIKPNTESLSTSTTSSVVTSIVSVILVDAWFAIATRDIGV